ncbi:Histidine kinase-, DNA gyrase B-, and HSP90-like ATPase [Allopseudospirillum japonicum]|uniref:histidine kinase n=1 Tax=Allopseudospirillum japonicum TaxID=64971 RepID=A0A1H6SMJ4_9GAMM|nr:ATP-binding protein [Allopseudospirillum japonicum]SEI65055.1 Histidine kinase-, DNA gyrase B-, and HSP90-like ATPase [Allopseudospirillum japonicum]
MKTLLFSLLFYICLMFSPASIYAELDQAINRNSLLQLMQQMQVPSLLIEPETGRIDYANPAAQQFYAYNLEEFQKLFIQDINTFTPEQVAQERTLAAQQERQFFIFRHQDAQGQLHKVRVYSQRLKVKNHQASQQVLLLSVILSLPEKSTEDIHQELLKNYQANLEEMVDLQAQKLLLAREQINQLLIGLISLQSAWIFYLIYSLQKQKRLRKAQDVLIEKIHQTNIQLARLSEVMAHHFQEPARRLVNFSQRLTLYKTELNQDASLCIDFIEQQARRLSLLVSQIQRYLAIEVDQTDVTQQHTSTRVDMSLHRLVQHFGPRLNQIKGSVELTETPAYVQLEMKKFQEIFTFLFENALAYRHPQRFLCLKISWYVHKDRVHFRFTDNGIGIAPADRERAFSLFTRLVKASDYPQGIGMGLALVQKYVHKYQGHISIEDGIEGGISILFDLPKGSLRAYESK